MNEKLRNLYARQDALLAQMRTLADKENMTDEDVTAYDVAEKEFDANEKAIIAEKKLLEREAAAKAPENKGFRPGAQIEVGVTHPPRPFKNLLDQLRSVKNAATTGRVDERLLQVNNAALGGNEGIGSEGGFAVQTDIAGAMMETAAKSGEILSRVDRYEVSGNANGVKWMDVDETSVATTVFGGVQVYWAAEAAQVTAKKPALMERELKLEKLMGLAYATYELESDSSFINALYTRAFNVAIQRELESCVVAGTGVGKLLGFLKSGSLVSVAKEAGQAADTVVWENISKMYNRQIDKASPGLVWLMHPDVHEQLDFLSFPVGVGGVPVYLQGTSQGQLDTLKGKPILESDQCSALGDQGDINLVDLSQYLLIYKGGVDAATSIHVQFLTAENCFRFIFRANGMPKKNAALTIKNSSNKRSSFVTLDARA